MVPIVENGPWLAILVHSLTASGFLLPPNLFQGAQLDPPHLEIVHSLYQLQILELPGPAQQPNWGNRGTASLSLPSSEESQPVAFEICRQFSSPPTEATREPFLQLQFDQGQNSGAIMNNRNWHITLLALDFSNKKAVEIFLGPPGTLMLERWAAAKFTEKEIEDKAAELLANVVGGNWVKAARSVSFQS